MAQFELRIFKKGQIWTIDLIVGVIIFFSAVTFFFILSNNITSHGNTQLDEIYGDLITVSNSLLSEGSPDNWSVDLIWDTHVKSDQDENFGESEQINLLFDGVNEWHGMLRYKIDCSEFPYGVAVLNLKLDANNLGALEGYSISVHRIMEHFIWEENNISYSIRPIEGADYDPAPTDIRVFGEGLPADWYMWSVTDTVNAFCSLGIEDVGLFLKSTLEIGDVDYEDNLSFDSKESKRNVPFILTDGRALLKTDHVDEFGLTDGNHRLNLVKLVGLASLRYPKLKLALKTHYDFLIFFEDKDGNVINMNNIGYIGKVGITKDNVMELEKPDNLASIRRFIIYNSEIITMVVYLWD